MDHASYVDGARLEARWWPPAAPAAAAPPRRAAPRGPGQRLHLARLSRRGSPPRTGRDVFAYSRRGHGASDAARRRPRAPTSCTARPGTSLPRVLDAAGIDRAVLFGHSDGGSIALLAAALHPDRVAALALEAPHVFVEDLSVASIAAIGERYRRDPDLRRRLAAHHAHVDEVFQGWNDVWLSADFRAWNIEAEVAAVRCPVLVAAGRRRRVRHHRADRRDRAAVATPR